MYVKKNYASEIHFKPRWLTQKGRAPDSSSSLGCRTAEPPDHGWHSHPAAAHRGGMCGKQLRAGTLLVAGTAAGMDARKTALTPRCLPKA